ncbi:MAG: 4-hydroxythreonine-4-phosphate dehydrogenase PdxA [Polyangiales bacterium]
MSAPLAIAVGDPAGVGPIVTGRALARALGRDRALVYGDPVHLLGRFRDEGLSARVVAPGDEGTLVAGEVGIVPLDPWPEAVIAARRPTADGGRIQLAILDAAAAAVRRGSARAIVTGPTSKEAITASGTKFVGQTEHLALAAGLRADDVTMMFLGPRLRVALVTTHLAIADAPAAITEARVRRTVGHMADALLRLVEPGTGRAPSLHVAGLNPHAGEGGLFGDEELRIVAPVLESMRAERPFSDGRVVLVGPRPAEAVFRMAASGSVDAVVAMLHDQATIASKLLDWGDAVNVTWGLPFVRTSVDHGVAYDAARDGTAEEHGMVAAIRMAQRLTERS